MIRKKPRFLRQSATAYKRLGEKWRKPRGRHSKLRKHKKSKGFIPSISYSTPRASRYLHPSGFREVVIYNLKDLEKIDVSKEAAKIAHGVGKKKRQEILKKAEELKLKILNP